MIKNNPLWLLDLGMCCNNETDTENETKTETTMNGLSAL